MVSKSHSKKSGFTMVELAVTMSIFAVLTSVVLANYRTFSNNADFLNVADSIALSLREAQIYGVGSKGASCGAPIPILNFQCAYGVVFSENDTFYKIFIDTNANSVYDPSDDEILQTVNLPSGSRITDVGCSPSGICSGVAVLFKRPNPDANILDTAGGGTSYDYASVTVANSTKKSVVSISRAGQISVVTTNNTL